MGIKFSDEEIKEVTDYVTTFVNNFDNTLKMESKFEYGNVLVLSFPCEEKQYRNSEKDRVGFRGVEVRVVKNAPENYWASMETRGWLILYRDRKKIPMNNVLTTRSNKLTGFKFAFFEKYLK